jgi:hypothetical protein
MKARHGRRRLIGMAKSTVKQSYLSQSSEGLPSLKRTESLATECMVIILSCTDPTCSALTITLYIVGHQAQAGHLGRHRRYGILARDAFPLALDVHFVFERVRKLIQDTHHAWITLHAEGPLQTSG